VSGLKPQWAPDAVITVTPLHICSSRTSSFCTPPDFSVRWSHSESPPPVHRPPTQSARPSRLALERPVDKPCGGRGITPHPTLVRRGGSGNCGTRLATRWRWLGAVSPQASGRRLAVDESFLARAGPPRRRVGQLPDPTDVVPGAGRRRRRAANGIAYFSPWNSASPRCLPNYSGGPSGILCRWTT